MTEISRSYEGGFEDRYRVTRVDGKPIPPDRRYIVLAYDGSDLEAVDALAFYADLKSESNPRLAADIEAALRSPSDWPSQHD